MSVLRQDGRRYVGELIEIGAGLVVSQNLDGHTELISVGGTFVVHGPWNNAVTYPVNAVVSYDGSSWIALVENTNVVPNEGATWTLLAASAAASGGVIDGGNF